MHQVDPDQVPEYDYERLGDKQFVHILSKALDRTRTYRETASKDDPEQGAICSGARVTDETRNVTYEACLDKDGRLASVTLLPIGDAPLPDYVPIAALTAVARDRVAEFNAYVKRVQRGDSHTLPPTTTDVPDLTPTTEKVVLIASNPHDKRPLRHAVSEDLNISISTADKHIRRARDEAPDLMPPSKGQNRKTTDQHPTTAKKDK